jgi:epoxyqueuosine reductase
LGINLLSLKDKIKTEAHSLGFSHIGFTNPNTPVHFDLLIDWINQGYVANMGYLSRPDTVAKRKDSTQILSSCKSIIALTLPYTPSKVNNQNDCFPKIAAYALGDDYHLVIPNLLEKLVDFIKNQVQPFEIEFRVYTDTGPILEREIAQNAGLGWIGKNSCLIIPGTGSFVFLAEILINLPFESDSVFEKDFCGNCTRCLDSCPTSCILPNRTIDSNRCISYLTIENRGNIPEELRTKIDSWIFGCDICQQVCPWNIKFSKEPDPNFFKPSESIQNLDLNNELRLVKSEFQNKYAKSPISRAKYGGYKRNLLIAARNNFKSEMTEPIQAIMNNADNPELRKLAVWALKNSKIPNSE